MRLVVLALLSALLAVPSVAAPLELHRGVSVHEWLNWSPLGDDGSYRWPPYQSTDEWRTRYRPLSEWPAGDEFVRIRSLGFDFIRLTVDPGPLLVDGGGRRDEALAVLAAAVQQVTQSGLKVVFNLHPITQVPAYSGEIIEGNADSEGVSEYIAMAADVAAMLAPRSDKVAFEPFNEPQHYLCEGKGDGQWQLIMSKAMAAIRAVSTELTVIATGACGGDIIGLVDLDPTWDDPNVLHSFHLYDPHLFTHQQSPEERGFASGLPWPASTGTQDAVVEALRAHMSAAGVSQVEQDLTLLSLAPHITRYFTEGWGEATMAGQFDTVTAWAKQHDIPTSRLFMGEFGVIALSDDVRRGAFNADRLRYLESARTLAESYNIPWAVWEYANPWGMSVILPSGPAIPDQPMLEALGL